EVYENYLGELLRSNARKEETIKQKQKSKRKSQGIYYTPAYIVDYIVKNTVGELLKNCKTVEDIEKIKVLDPACGSGSFLIRAFEEFYNKYLEVSKEGGLLSFEFRKKVLQKNLFGVDLDPKAIEITKLNLMIKTLEGVTPNELKGKHLLPNLNLNIKCGNSLIGGEKLKEKEQNLNLFDDYKTEIDKLVKLKEKFYQAEENEEKKKLLDEINKFETLINGKLNEGLKQYFKNLDKIKPFNYSVAFCEIFKDGGFDAVIGNPPYLSIERGLIDDINFFKDTYETLHKIYDIFGLFIEKGIQLLKNEKFLGFIIPNIILQNDSFELLRKKILENTKIISIDDYKDGVFSGAVVPTAIIVLQKSENYSRNKINIKLHSQKSESESKLINQSAFLKNNFYRFNLEISKSLLELKKKLYEDSKLLKYILKIQEAIKTGDDKKFISDSPDNFKNPKVLLKGRDIDRYFIKNERYIDYNINSLKRPGNQNMFELPKKLYIRRVGNSIIAILDDKQRYAVHTLYTGVIIDDNFLYEYILCLLNSKLFTYLYRNSFPFKGTVFPEIRIGNLGELPVKVVSKSEQNKFVKKAKELIKLNKTSESREKNADKTRALDYEIDKEVYELYNLTPEEVKVVEGE
ncbi:MAG: N-6 DNA methylase, partial [Candidatus Buchananbacteria bacterium]|nr:N-6 DNA methylase [Candidatus Buchananbacteria bacterium]